MNAESVPGVRQQPSRSGQVSTASVQLLQKYGASPRLLRKVKEVTADRNTIALDPGISPVSQAAPTLRRDTDSSHSGFSYEKQLSESIAPQGQAADLGETTALQRPAERGRSVTEARQTVLTPPSLEGITKHLQEMGVHDQQQCIVRIDALEMLMDAKLTALRTIIDLQAERSVSLLESSDKAISKAEVALEKRFESVNEFRKTLSDQAKSFISRAEFEALRDATGNRIAGMSSRLDKIEGKAVGLNTGWIYLLGGLSAIGAVVSVIVAILLHKG